MKECFPCKKRKPDPKPIENIISEVNLHNKENAQAHHTSDYTHVRRGDVVVRRGQSFKVTIKLKKRYRKRDNFDFIFRCVDNSLDRVFPEGTVVIPLWTKSESVHSWKATLDVVSKKKITVHITPPPTCIIGRWHLTVSYRNFTLDLDENVFIIFNPWCREDQVYLESKSWRDETVLSTHGLIWKERPPHPGICWNFSQFCEDVLECALYCLSNVVGLSLSERSDPVRVARALSASINSQDDNGVLLGRWNNDFSDGVPPSHWTGSRQILQQYYRNKKTVNYGQCWVFAGVLTTVCRTIGLPSRPVSNFVSGHDTNASISIEYIVDDQGRVINNLDTIWNYHVWAEAWMRRPDLGDAYGGWQVIDSTPQERSNGIYQCGPASVVAVKHGNIHKPFDVGFVFAEVNADEVYYRGDKIVKKVTDRLGQLISTKATGKFKRLDITNTYKFDEHSKEERATYIKVMNQVDSNWSQKYLANEFKEIVFKFDYKDDILIGENFNVSLVMINTNVTVTYPIKIILRLDVYSYNGKFLDNAKIKADTDLTLLPGATLKFEMEVTYKDYKHLIADNAKFVISCLADVESIDYIYYDRDDFKIINPHVDVEVQHLGGKEWIGTVSVQNPLPVALKSEEFLVDVPWLDTLMRINARKRVAPGDAVVETFNFALFEPGRYTVAVKFISKQLHNVDGFKHFIVE